jgi:murein DD-endopeptidase MepM/ murein hydrolase activator NlpD
MKLVAGSVALLTVLAMGTLFTLVALVALTASVASSSASAAVNPSAEATADIPPALLALFIRHAPSCRGLPWTVLAAISKVETDHGRAQGAVLGDDGTVAPSIRGPALDGTNGNAALADTDGGALDGDTVWDRAVGPFQFIPSSWQIFGQDGNGDGVANPDNIHDAVPAAVAHLCPEGHVEDLRAAVYSYNQSDTYVDAVLQWARRYTGPLAVIATAGYALPVPAAQLTEAQLTAPHHDYPAWDLGLPVGTPLFAMVDGTITVATTAGIYPADPNRCGNSITLTGVDGARYTYCHLSAIAVTAGQPILAGSLIGLSGGQPGTPGAGNTTGPHLHVGITADGRSIFPQPLLIAIYRLTPVNPAIAPSSGCVQGAPQTDWGAWVDSIVRSSKAQSA